MTANFKEIEVPESHIEEISKCRSCGIKIDFAELCGKCAEGNDPFFSSKYNER
jgi:hypothetical protein